jgi:hypothetical protein
MYDYEKIIFASLASSSSSLYDTQDGNGNANSSGSGNAYPHFSSSNKHLWIKKATGLGISKFMFRFMAWLCLNDNALSGSQMFIVTGPRID